MIRPGHLRSRIGLAAAGSGCRRLLPIVLAIIFANVAGQTPAWAAGEQPPLTPIAGITRALDHQNITVEALISQVAEPQNGKPYYVTLAQGSATIPLIYWPDMQAQLGPKVQVGNTIRAKLTVGTYREQLQLRIRDANDLQVIVGVTAPITNASPAAAAVTSKATAAPATPPTDTVIGRIKVDWADRPVIISGTVSEFRTAGKSWQLKVQDRTGEIAVVLGEKATAGLAFTELKPGWVVAVTGPVKVYQGIPAVVPEVAGAVKVTPQ